MLNLFKGRIRNASGIETGAVVATGTVNEREIVIVIVEGRSLSLFQGFSFSEFKDMMKR